MKGIQKVKIYTKRVHYEFELRRNITIIRGDSATGKTTLVDMVQEYVNNPSGSPVNLICDKSCYVLSGALWREQLFGMHDSIVFIDEGNEFIKTDEFAREIQQTDNYYVIVTRESLPSLPYSVEEIYGIRESGKFKTLKQRFHEFYQIYGMEDLQPDIRPESIITEDSNSGFQFFDAVCKEQKLSCISAGGKSNVFQCLKNAGRNALVVADGAAFGAEIDRVLQLIKTKENAYLYLPESFEWMILTSGIIKDKELTEVLENPSEFIESKEYFSWERYFTSLLTEKTKDTYLAYTKRKLNEVYLNEKEKRLLLDVMSKIEL